MASIKQTPQEIAQTFADASKWLTEQREAIAKTLHPEPAKDRYRSLVVEDIDGMRELCDWYADAVLQSQGTPASTNRGQTRIKGQRGTGTIVESAPAAAKTRKAAGNAAPIVDSNEPDDDDGDYDEQRDTGAEAAVAAASKPRKVAPPEKAPSVKGASKPVRGAARKVSAPAKGAPGKVAVPA